MEMTPCVACGDAADRAYQIGMTQCIKPKWGEWIHQCLKCGLGWIEPMPDAHYVEAYYASGEYAKENADVAYATSDYDVIKERLARIETLGGKPRLVDVGCGTGAFVFQAILSGWDAVGYDLAPHPVVDISYGAADCVHMSHVLEHMIDPLGELRVANSMLKCGGVLVVECPSELSDLMTSVRSFFGCERERARVKSPHLWFFNAKSLPMLIEKAGFKVLSVRTVRRNPDVKSKYKGVGTLKRAVYAIEQWKKQGPIVEVFARKER